MIHKIIYSHKQSVKNNFNCLDPLLALRGFACILGVADCVGSGEGLEGGFKYAIKAIITANRVPNAPNAIQKVTASHFHTFFVVFRAASTALIVNPNKSNQSRIVWGRASGSNLMPSMM